LSQLEHEIKALMSQDDPIKLNEAIPQISNLVNSVLERVKDIYQVYPALLIVSDFLTVAPKKIPQLFI